MTDRHSGYLVILKADIREDDAKDTLIALGQLKGVLSVEPIISDIQQQIAVSRARRELGSKLFDTIYPGMYNEK